MLIVKDPELVHACSDSGWQPIHSACQEGHLAMAQYLMTKGAKVDVRCSAGDQPLHFACMKGRLEIAKWLVKQGAPLRIRDKNRKAPIDIARDVGFSELAAWLDEGEQAILHASIEHIRSAFATLKQSTPSLRPIYARTTPR